MSHLSLWRLMPLHRLHLQYELKSSRTFYVFLQGMSRPSISDALGHGRDSDGELEVEEIVPRRGSPGTDGTVTALLLYSYCTDTVLLLYCTVTALSLYSHCTVTATVTLNSWRLTEAVLFYAVLSCHCSLLYLSVEDCESCCEGRHELF